MFYLSKIKTPCDVKKIPQSELPMLAQEMRMAILNRSSKIGGHVGPNLCVVEATIALHYVFDAPRDKIVFDVSHQCYSHKLLTGRSYCFLDDTSLKDVSGYTSTQESEFDLFTLGHTSTSISLSCGLAVARDRLNEKHHVISFIGDGSLGGGEALEGLNFAGELNTRLIIVVNDNEMSIAENHGGLYQNLRLLRETNGTAELNLFKAMGLNYLYVENGNNLTDLIRAFTQAKEYTRPVIIHIHTQKGLGYRPAERDKELFHHPNAFDLESGKIREIYTSENYPMVISDYLIMKSKQNPKLVVVNAGTPGAVGFTPDKRRAMGDRFIDVGIAEEHACSMVSALAKGGCRPVWCVQASFAQRSYDQLSHDLALNKNPAVVLVFRTGISAFEATEQSTFDMSMLSHVPNLICMAPTTKEECLSMIDWAVTQDKYPVIIRIPSRMTYGIPLHTDYDNINTSVITKTGSEVAIFALGAFYDFGERLSEELQKIGVYPTLINPRYFNGVDEDLLNNLKKNHKIVITLEDGMIDGGFGQKIATFYGPTDVKVLVYGAFREFTDRVPLSELYNRYRLTSEQIICDIQEILK